MYFPVDVLYCPLMLVQAHLMLVETLSIFFFFFFSNRNLEFEQSSAVVVSAVVILSAAVLFKWIQYFHEFLFPLV